VRARMYLIAAATTILLAGITGVALAPGARLRSERPASPAARLPVSRRAGESSVGRLDCR
jgi:hypothetical protein